VHTQDGVLPVDYHLVTLNIPEQMLIQDVDTSLPCPDAGQDWLRRAESAVLRVPSVITPRTFNYILNPQHEDMTHIQIIEIVPFVFDSRLVRQKLL